MEILGLDHLVLTVKSIQDTCRFYETILGMKTQVFGAGRVALKFGQQKINLHEAGHELEPKAKAPVPGSADLCFVVNDVARAMKHVIENGVEIEQGPVERTGANGPILSVYLRDLDGNLLELSSYSGKVSAYAP